MIVRGTIIENQKNILHVMQMLKCMYPADIACNKTADWYDTYWFKSSDCDFLLGKIVWSFHNDHMVRCCSM